MKSAFRQRLILYAVAVLARYLLYWNLYRLEGIDPFAHDPDTWEFVNLAQSILAGDWANRIFVDRTPLYPAILAGLLVLAGNSARLLVLVQIFFTALTPVLGYHFARRATHEARLAFLTGLILAVDPAAVAADVPVLTEGFAALFAAGAFWALYRFLGPFGGRLKPRLQAARCSPRRACPEPAREAGRALRLPLPATLRSASSEASGSVAGQAAEDTLVGAGRWRDLLVGAGLWSLNLFIRPAALYYAGVAALLIVFVRPRGWRQAAVWLAICIAPVVAWTARNIHFAGIPVYSTSGTYTLLFYKSVSTEAFLTGRSPGEIGLDYAREIEVRLGQPERAETITMGPGLFENLYPTDPARYAVIETLAREKLLANLPWHILLIPAGFDMFLKTGSLPKWFGPPLQYTVNGAACALALVGMIAAWRRRRLDRAYWLLALSAMGYFTLLTAFVNPGLAYTRYRTPFGVFWSLFVAIGLAALWRFVRRNRG